MMSLEYKLGHVNLPARQLKWNDYQLKASTPSLKGDQTDQTALVIYFHETRVVRSQDCVILFPIETLTIFMLRDSIAHKATLSKGPNFR